MPHILLNTEPLPMLRLKQCLANSGPPRKSCIASFPLSEWMNSYSWHCILQFKSASRKDLFFLLSREGGAHGGVACETHNLQLLHQAMRGTQPGRATAQVTEGISGKAALVASHALQKRMKRTRLARWDKPPRMCAQALGPCGRG